MTCNKWYELMKSLGLENDLKTIYREKNVDYKLISNDINLERLNNNPIKISSVQIKQLFL